jgi:small-conductance mechanosensitive channel
VPTVQKILCDAALAHPAVLQDPPPVALLKDFGESSLDFELLFSSAELWQIGLVTAEIRVTALNKFREAKIELPFPQRDVHLHTV